MINDKHKTNFFVSPYAFPICVKKQKEKEYINKNKANIIKKINSIKYHSKEKYKENIYIYELYDRIATTVTPVEII